MSNILKDSDTAAIADLIKIHIPEGELPKYTSQLNTVLSAVEVMNTIDTDKVMPTSQTHGLTNITAPDEVEPGLDISEYPNRHNLQNGYFVIKQVLPDAE